MAYIRKDLNGVLTFNKQSELCNLSISESVNRSWMTQTATIIKKLDNLIEYVKSERRICPDITFWMDFWNMLPEKKKLSKGWEPPEPTILAGWYVIPPLFKMLIFHEQIKYAADHNFLDEADQYLRSLSLDQWFYLGQWKEEE